MPVSYYLMRACLLVLVGAGFCFSQGDTALIVAAGQNHIEIFRQLLNRGADVNKFNQAMRILMLAKHNARALQALPVPAKLA